MSCEAGWLGQRVNLGAEHDWSREMYRPCLRKAITTVTSGCVHEHVETWKVCMPCQLAILRRGAQEAPVCVLCARDHKCRVLVSVPGLTP